MSDLDRKVDILDELEEAKSDATQQSIPSEEQASVDSVKKAENSAPTAKKRKGDQNGKDEPEGSKEKSFKNKMWEGSEVDFGAEFDALTESEATLSEAFKEKAATIFEAAINVKLSEEVARLEEQYEEQLTEATEEIKNDLAEKVNSYLNYVVENWMEENELAIEQSIRTEVAENFMENLKALFVESYIEVPESKVDLVDALADEVAELEEQLNTALNDNIELSESLLASKKEAVLAEAKEGLTIQQADKLAKLVEGIEASSVESFTKKVATIKEAYFSQKEVVVAEDVEDGAAADEKEALAESYEGPMAHYLAAIDRINKNK